MTIAPQTPESRQAALDRIAEGVTPMEPRILLDAVLTLDTGLTGGEALHVAADALNAQSDEAKRVFDGVEQVFGDSFGAAAGAYDGDPATGLGDAAGEDNAADIVFQGVRTALDASLAAFEANLSGFIADQGSALVDALNAALPAGASALTGDVQVGPITVPGSVSTLFTADLLADEAAFDSAAAVFAGGTLSDAQQATLGDVLSDAFVSFADAQGVDLFQLDLDDRTVSGAQVIFTQAGNDVRVSAQSADLTFETPGTIAQAGISGNGITDVSAPVRGFDIGFDLSTTLNTDEFRIDADNFSAATFEIGEGVVFQGNALGVAPVNDIVVPAVITEVETATHRFTPEGFGDLGIAGVHDRGLGLTAGLTEDATITFAAEVREVGETAFEAVVPGDSYAVVQTDYTELLGSAVVALSQTPVLQSAAPQAFSTALAGAGLGFDGAGSGDAVENTNDAGLILGGLTAILESADEAIETLLAATSLPLIGNKLGVGFTLFDDLRFDILPRAEAQANSTDSTGNRPTTVDLMAGFINDEINVLLGTTGVTYLQATLTGFDNSQQNFLVGNLGFTQNIFSAELSAPLEFGVDLPGLDLNFENGSPLTLDVFADLNIGFGVDKDGFFVLNDTNEAEISLDFVVDAGDFEGQFSVANILDVTAVAVADPTQRALFDFAPEPAADESGDLKLSASLEADLFGSLGTTLSGANKTNLNPFDLQKGDGTTVTYEKQTRIAEIDRAQSLGQGIAETNLTADADINLQLTAEVLDPLTGQPILINGVSAVPKLVTELVLDASLTNSGQVKLDTFLLNDLRLDATPLFDGYIKPIIDPLEPFTGPLGDLLDRVNVQPFKSILNLGAQLDPTIALVQDVVTLTQNAVDLVEGLQATGGFVVLGDQFFDENGNLLGIGDQAKVNGVTVNVGELNSSKIEEILTPEQLALLAKQEAFGIDNDDLNSLSIDLPVFTDPRQALALLNGDFANVELITATYTGIDIDIDSANIVGVITDALDVFGGDVADVVDELVGKFPASASFDMFFGFEIGYDLSGLNGFVNTYDPARLFDGIFLDATQELLEFSASASLDFSVGVDIGIASGEAGLEVSGSGNVDIEVADPNGDGKLRLNEIFATVDTLGNDAGSAVQFLKAFFDGRLNFEFEFSLFGEVKAVGITVLDESLDFIEFDKDINFDTGPSGIGEADLRDTLNGGTVVLNVGDKISDSFFVRNVIENEGSFETITLEDFPGGETFLNWLRVDGGDNAFVTSTPFVGDTFTANSIIIPAGDGRNNVDMSELTGTDTLTYLGDGPVNNNVVDLASDGFHVVFGGDTGNLIRAEDGVTGTYWVFGGEGADTISINGGNVIAFGEDIFGVRKAFLAEFGDGGFTQAEAERVFVEHMAAQGIGDGFDAADPTGSFTAMIAALEQSYTQRTQLLAGNVGDSFDLGDDDSTINRVFAAGGDDFVLIAGGRDAQVMLGAGDDEANIRTDRSSLVEGGAGSDRMTGGDAADNMFGYAAVLGKDGSTADKALNALANQDGDDVILSGGGNDSLFGQRGNNLIEGSGGDDSIIGGRGDDIVFGGKLNTTLGSGQVLDFGEISLSALKGQTFSALVFDDGSDKIGGGAGDDIVIGGADADTVIGAAGSNILIGDFAEIAFVTGGQVTSVKSVQIGAAENGRDLIQGGTGLDVMIGGGGTSATGFFDGDRLEDGSGGNIFIGDDAEITGPNVLGDATSITALSGAGADSGDILETGFSGGFDIMIGGEGGDLINGDGGGNILIGDLGAIDLTAGTITTTEDDLGGDDTLGARDSQQEGDFGAANFIIGGKGADFLRGTVFTDYALGDSGSITFDNDIREAMNATNFVNRIAAFGADPVATADEIAAEDALLVTFAGLVTRMESTGLATDGDDRFDLDAGGDRFIGGGGSDGAFANDGVTPLDQNGRGGLAGIFVLDSGEIDLANGTAEAVSSEFGGNDLINTGAGNHLILAGDGDDTVVLGKTEFSTRAATPEELASIGGDGNHAILGDSGTITFDTATLAATKLVSLSNDRDGADTVRPFANVIAGSPVAGQGGNLVILGGGADSLQLGNGDNTVLGDGGQIDLTAGSISSQVTVPDGATDPFSLAGDDTLTLGTGFNRVIAGGGSDTVLLDGLGADATLADAVKANGGTHVVITDEGEISFDAGTTNITRAASIGKDFDGNDLLRAGNGNHRVILGGNLDLVVDGNPVSGVDDAILGNGGNFVVGDTGIINLSAGAMSGEANDKVGVDRITAGSGNNFVIAGGRADTVDLGQIFDGDGVLQPARAVSNNVVIGDSGLIEFDTGARTLIRMNSDSTGEDGSDTVRLGGGENRVILGGGSDSLTADPFNSTARNIIVGDAGSIDTDLVAVPGFGQAASALSQVSKNNDTIETGRGADIIIAGQGDDSITSSGDNAILGDLGRISFDAATGALTSMGGNATGVDGNDTVLQGFGRANVVLGGGDDSFTERGSGSSDRILIGDGGFINFTAGTAEGTAKDLEDGIDHFIVTRSDSLMIGGGAGDIFQTGADANIILGDTGLVNFTTAVDGTRSFNDLTSSITATDGDDEVIQREIGGETGKIIAILGGGADSVTATGSNNKLVGDGGTIDLVTEVITANANSLSGNDTFALGAGDNIVLAGQGADSITAGDGNNTILGDAGQVTVGTSASAGNGADDGADEVSLGNGDNRVILGGAGDSLTAGNGGNVIIGDGGQISFNANGAFRATTTGFDTATGAPEGDDDITIGTGDNIVIAGAGSDTVSAAIGTTDPANAGTNAIITSLGQIDFTTALVPTLLASVVDARDGADSVTAGASDDLVILGEGGDRANLGEGNNIVLGDHGSINMTTGTATASDVGTSANDILTVGNGTNIAAGGGASDRITLGTGTNAALGDFGTVLFDTGFVATKLSSTASSAGAADTVTGTGTANQVILGEGNDSASLAGGTDIVLGDNGEIDLGGNTLTAADNGSSGADTIDVGEGTNLVAGGGAGDRISLGAGTNGVLGDFGTITFQPTGAAVKLTSATSSNGSGDTVTGTGGTNQVILGDGNDSANMGAGTDIILGDNGEIDLATGTVTATDDTGRGSDTVSGGNGTNIILGGALGDSLTAGTGDDALLGDNGTITFATATGVVLTLTGGVASTDGDDAVNAGDGLNKAVLSGGKDTGSFGTGTDIVIGDGGIIDLAAGSARNAPESLGDADHLTLGEGNNIALGGSQGDSLTAGDGNNLILGDTGEITFDAVSLTGLRLVSTSDVLDGEDTLGAGSGDNRAIMGGKTDTITLTNGNNIVLMDDGEIDLVTGFATTGSDSLAGTDSLTAGNGNNLFIGGSDADDMLLGDGDNAVLTDTGRIDFDPTTRAPLILTSAHDARDGADEVTTGNGDSRVIMGGASDTGSFGTGDNIVLGDSGSITETAGDGSRTAETSDEADGAADSITANIGNDVILAGGGADSVAATGGNNVVLGDGGTVRLVSGQPDNLLLGIDAKATAIGAADSITTGFGQDIVIGAVGDDSISAGAESDIVAGDWINVVTPLATGGQGTITSVVPTVGGNDLIDTGSGNDIAVGGQGDDVVELGFGFDVGLGDTGTMAYVNDTDIETLVLLDLEQGGADTISATGLGDNLIVGQAGADSLSGGESKDILVGDLATFTFLPFGTFGLTDSAVDRLVQIDFIRPDIAFDDTIDGGPGRDYLLAGFGDDSLQGGDGQDLLAGDSFSLDVTYVLDALGNAVDEQLTFESNLALVTGGFDLLDGGDGPDIVVGDLGPDGFNGNTADDFLAGDAVAFTTSGPYTPTSLIPAAAGAPPPPQFNLISVNFAGPGPGDVLSSAQVGNSLGFQLDQFAEAADAATGLAAISAIAASGLQGEDLTRLLSDRAETLFEAVRDTSTSAASLQRIAALLALDVPPEMLAEMLQQGLAQQVLASLEGDLSPLDRYLVMRLIEEVIKPALEAAEAAREGGGNQAAMTPPQQAA